jgi:hypothetical protein
MRNCNCPEDRHGCQVHTIDCNVTKSIAKSNKFCWICSRRFWGNRKYLIEAEGYYKVVHKSCAKQDGFKTIIPV